MNLPPSPRTDAVTVTERRFTWQLETAAGVVVTTPTAPVFSSQADAETWLGEHFRTLADGGVDQVSLLADGVVSYGPMSLHP